MDGSGILAIVGLAAGVGLILTARRRAPVSPTAPEMVLPGLAVSLDGGDGALALSAGHGGQGRVLSALGLTPQADAAAVRAAIAALNLSGGRHGADLIHALEHQGTAFSASALTPQGHALRLEGYISHNRPMLWVLAFDAPAHERAHFSLTDMLDRAPFPAWRLNAAGTLDWGNGAFLTALGLAGLDQAVQQAASFGREVEGLARRAAAENQTVEEFIHIAINGQRRLCQVRAFPSADGVACMAFDVTDAAEARDALARHLQAQSETLDHVAEGVAIFGRDKRLMFHNKAFADLWGLDPIWLADKPAHGAILDHLRERRRLPEVPDYGVWKARELGFYESLKDVPDELWTRPDGRTLRVFRQPHPMGGVLLLFDDMTGELALKTQYNALIGVQRATLDKLHEAVAVFSGDGRLRLFNAAFEAMWHLDGRSLSDHPPFDEISNACAALYPDAASWQTLKARITDPSPETRIPTEGTWQRSDGTVVQYRSRPLPDGATLIAWVDITDSQRIEQALRDRAAALEDADRLKSDFVAHVSYQLRSPLTTIMGYADLMAAGIAGALNDKQTAQLDSIRAGAAQLGKLIEDILDLATLEAGELELELGDVHLPALITSAISLAATKADDTRVHIHADCPVDLPVIRADEKRLKQALYNLIANALRHTPSGGRIDVGARVDDGQVQLWVYDSGDGMTTDTQARAFDSFASGPHGGAGLGLALVRSFIDMHGGWVDLHSTPGAGTRVTCHLPQTRS